MFRSRVGPEAASGLEASSGGIRPKLLWLEGFRFLAAASIIILHFHMFDLGRVNPPTHAITHEPFFSILAPIYALGAYAVEFFWLLSGIIFHLRYREALASGNVTLRSFVVARFARLWPLAAATSVLVYLLQKAFMRVNHSFFDYTHNGFGDLLRSFVFAQQWRHPSDSFSLNGPLWSVSLEVIAYAVFFALAVSVARHAPKLYTALLYLSFGGLLALSWAQNPMTLAPNPIFECVLCFFAGGAILALVTSVLEPRRLLRRASLLAATLLALGLPVYFYSLARRYKDPFNLAPGGLALMLLFLSCLLLIGLLAPSPGQGLGKVLSQLGALTYSSYLIHFPIILLLEVNFFRFHFHPTADNPYLTFGWLLLTFALSYPCYRYFELPAQRWLRAKLSKKSVGLRRRDLSSN